MNGRRSVALLLAIITLLLYSCGQDFQPETTTADENKEAISEERDKMTEFTEKSANIELMNSEEIAGLFNDFNLLNDDEKSETGFEIYKRMADKEYSLIHQDILASIDDHKVDVLISMAKAFYNQSNGTLKGVGNNPQLFYDQYNNRRNLNIHPEDITAAKELYLDCSSFVGAVYFNTFGHNCLSNYAAINMANLEKQWADSTVPKYEDFVFIDETQMAELKADPEKLASKIAEIKLLLEPGDIIAYHRSSGSGHVIMYVGAQKFMHSTGTANPACTNLAADPITSIEKRGVDEGKFGTINIDNWDRFFTTTVTPKSQNDGRSSTSNSFLFADNVTKLVIFRPMNKENGRSYNDSLTRNAIDHYIYEGIDIEKTFTVKHGDSVKELATGNSLYVGDEIECTVTVANASEKVMKSLLISETIPTNTEFVSSSDGAVYFKGDNIVAWHVNELESGKEIAFVYTIKILNTATAGTIIEDKNTYVNHIKVNSFMNQVSKAELDRTAFTDALNAAIGTKCNDAFAVVRNIYSQIDNAGFSYLKGFNSSSDVVDKVLASKQLQYKSPSGMIAVRTLYGGYNVGYNEAVSNSTATYDAVNVRIRRVKLKCLENGDIIVTYSQYQKAYRSFIYCDGELYGVTTDGTFGKADMSLYSKSTSDYVQGYLDTLTAYNCFVVLRPAIRG